MATKPPVWVIRWLGPFGVTYIGRDPEVRSIEYRGKTVYDVGLAKTFRTKERAESAALILASKHEEFIGTLDPREWNGRKRYP